MKLSRILALVFVLAAFCAPAAHSQSFIPIPNEASGSGCPPYGNDPTQCSGYKVRNDTNARFSGAVPITPSFTSATITTASATIPAGASVIYANPSTNQALTLYPAITGFHLVIINQSAFTVTVTPIGGTIGNLSSWTIAANYSLAIEGAASGNWSLSSQSPNSVAFAKVATSGLASDLSGKGSIFATGTVSSITAPTAVGCSDTTASVASVTTSMSVLPTPQTNPNGSGGSVSWHGFVSSAGTIDIRVCNATTETSPPSVTYNYVVFD